MGYALNLIKTGSHYGIGVHDISQCISSISGSTCFVHTVVIINQCIFPETVMVINVAISLCIRMRATYCFTFIILYECRKVYLHCINLKIYDLLSILIYINTSCCDSKSDIESSSFNIHIDAIIILQTYMVEHFKSTPLIFNGVKHMAEI